MIMEFLDCGFLNCRAEIGETMEDYDRIMEERRIAIEYWAGSDKEDEK